jgi:hypothetical protein
MMFSTGMPVLYPIALVNFFVTYWFDKLMGKRFVIIMIVLKYYKTPSSLPLEFSEMTLLIIQYSVIPHCIMGYLMYNNSNILPLR